jgi:hypothetical protein
METRPFGIRGVDSVSQGNSGNNSIRGQARNTFGSGVRCSTPPRRVIGKTIDAPSICIATAAANQVGREGSIFRSVFWHSVALASIAATTNSLPVC